MSMDAYAVHHNAWRWTIPDRFNVADFSVHRWAKSPQHKYKVAIYWEDDTGRSASINYGDLARNSNRLANALAKIGVQRGDRIAICLPQRIQTAISLLAVVQIGAIAVPLTVLFGEEAMSYRLNHAHCSVALCDDASIGAVLQSRSKVNSLKHIVYYNENNNRAYDDDIVDFDTLIASASEAASVLETLPNDPALIIYTSGTTGQPKGALIPQQAMLGNIPGFIYSHNLRSATNKSIEDVAPFVFYSPADWAWTGGLWDALLPTLFLGQTIVGYRGRFDPERTLALMEKYEVSATFLFPTALKMMMKAIPSPRERYNIKLRSIMSAGESVGETVFNWAHSALGVTVNEMFGQTELNYVVGNCSALWPARAGSMGCAYPGHQVAVVDDDGNVLPPGSTGDVAVNRFDIHGDPDPVFFLCYLNNEPGTAAKYSGDWCRTGDMARIDADGYLWYEGRSDDVIKSAGYRIGPAEVESCLIQHPAVAMAAVIGKPDTERGTIVKAFVILAAGYKASPELEAGIAKHVRDRLAPYEYPKEIEFVSELPMTTTGKIQRKVLREREMLRMSGAALE
jgi:acetyl-CoA synthetase